jgi:hypothetical protein
MQIAWSYFSSVANGEPIRVSVVIVRVTEHVYKYKLDGTADLSTYSPR